MFVINWQKIVELYPMLISTLAKLLPTITLIFALMEIPYFVLVIGSPHKDTGGWLFLNILIPIIIYFVFKNRINSETIKAIVFLVISIANLSIFFYLRSIKYYS